MKNQANKQVIIFEELFPIHKWIVKWYLFRKKEVYYLRLNNACCHLAWIKERIHKKHIRHIDLNFDLNEIEGTYYDKAFDNITIFFQIFNKNKILSEIKELYENRDIDLAFRKALNEKLGRFYYLNYILSRIQDRHGDAKILCVPSNGVEFFRTDRNEAREYIKFYKLAGELGAELFNTDNVTFPLWKIACADLNAFFRKIGVVIKTLGFLCWLCVQRCKGLYKVYPLKKTYKYAIMIISHLRQFSNNVQKVDFLIDNDLIKKSECVFISYNKLEEKHVKYMNDHQLNYIDDLNTFISWGAIKRAVRSSGYLLLQLNEEDYILEESLKLIYYYVRWSSFAIRSRVDNLISHADFNSQSIARNIILEKYGCRSYYYLDSLSYGYASVKENSSIQHRHNWFGFLHYDSLISWCDKVHEYLENSFCKFKHYMNLGCLWAEHLRLIQEGKITSELKSRLYLQGYKENMKLISIFDSTFNDTSLYTYKDGIRFLEEILRLLNDMPDLFIVLKEKKSRGFHRIFTQHSNEILETYAKLDRHERCYSVDSSGNSSDVIACSDLTVSFSFTSPTFEALSVRKKAIWYDGANKFRGTFYDQVPGLVCHNYEELLSRVKELLFNISDWEYDNYLDKYVKGTLETYLDGRAISRFRERIAGGDRYNEFSGLSEEVKSA